MLLQVIFRFVIKNNKWRIFGAIFQRTISGIGVWMNFIKLNYQQDLNETGYCVQR